MTVSVVVTCFNLERYIGEAIDSAAAAMAGIDGEIIVVDDCSTDGSAEVIRGRGVRYLKTARNVGVMLATLAGIAAARHSIIAFLDGDDVWRPDKLRLVLDAFAADAGTALVTHDVAYMDSAGDPLPMRGRPGRSLRRTPPEGWSEHLRRSILEHRDDIWLGSALSVHRQRARLDDFAALMGQRPDAAEMYQDWPLAAWIAAQPAARLAFVPEALFSYRLHGANYSGDALSASRALRNFTRTRNSIRLMAEIADRGGQLNASLRRHLALAEGQVALYEGRPWSALGHYAAAFPAYVRRPVELAKEAARWFAIASLGPERGQRFLKRAINA